MKKPKIISRYDIGFTTQSLGFINDMAFISGRARTGHTIIAYKLPEWKQVWKCRLSNDPTRGRFSLCFDSGNLFVVECNLMTDAGAILSINGASGDIIWKRNVRETPPNARPTVVGEILLCDFSGGIIAFNKFTGKKIWKKNNIPYDGNYFVDIKQGKIFLASLAHQYGILAINSQTGDVLWSFSSQDWEKTPIGIINNYVIIVGDDYRRYLLNAESGKIVDIDENFTNDHYACISQNHIYHSKRFGKQPERTYQITCSNLDSKSNIWSVEGKHYSCYIWGVVTPYVIVRSIGQDGADITSAYDSINGDLKWEIGEEKDNILDAYMPLACSNEFAWVAYGNEILQLS